MAEQKEENQKTIVSFVVGLLIGGLLVWAFSGDTDTKPVDTKKDAEKEMGTEKETGEMEEATDEETTPVLPVGDGAASVEDGAAGMSVSLKDVTFPTKEGWVGIRDYSEGKLGLIKGVARFSSEQGLKPTEVILVSPTVAGKEYAVVFYSESGDRKFNLADDVQIDKEFATFTAK
jgi:hypothetical protein